MKEKDKQLISKIVIIAFLVMLVVGFSVPGFLELGDDNTNTNSYEPKVCQSDADCYLICDDIPVKVLCLQNLCQQNVCEEQPYYSYQEIPLTFSLSIKVNGDDVEIKDLFSEKNIFIKFQEKVQIFTTQLALDQIIEQAQIKIDNSCLRVNGEDYCTSSEKELKILVNGEESFSGYQPQQDDVIKIIFS